MKVGSTRKMSIGFNIADSEMDGRLRILKEIDLHEISLVTFPANPAASVSGFKAVTPFKDFPIASRSRSWDSTEAIARVRAHSDSTESPSSTYRNFFLWYDADDAENFGAYKMSFVDIIDGEPHVIPRAINNAKARLDQTDIPAADKERVLANINRYQAKFEDSSDGKMFNLEDVIDIKDKRDLRNFFKSTDIFTKQAREHIMETVFKSAQGDLGDDEGQVELDQKAADELSSLFKSFNI